MEPLLYYVVRPLFIGVLIVLSVWGIILGVQFWMDVTGPPLLESLVLLESPDSAIEVVAFVPNRIQPGQKYGFEFEVTPSVHVTQVINVSIDLREDSPFVSTDMAEPAIYPGTPSAQASDVVTVCVHTRNLRVPPDSVVFMPQIKVNDRLVPEVQPFSVAVDAWTGKTISALEILGGLVGSLLGLIKGVFGK